MNWIYNPSLQTAHRIYTDKDGYQYDDLFINTEAYDIYIPKDKKLRDQYQRAMLAIQNAAKIRDLGASEPIELKIIL